ncbi:MAG: caspase family protein, partial [Saprospiraceae bacterium]|nr:caspase family protein [Saprospiraceae bacterium]
SASRALFDPKGRFIVTSSSDLIRVRDWTGKVIREFSNDGLRIEKLACTADGETLLTIGFSDIILRLWDLSGRKIAAFGGGGSHWRQLNSAAFSPDGKQILTGSRDNKTILWDTAGNKIREYTGAGFPNFPYPFDISRDGQKLVVNSRKPVIWDLTLGKILSLPRPPGPALAFSPDATLILTGGSGAEAKLWDWQNNTTQNLPGDSLNTEFGIFSPDSRYVLTLGNWDLFVRLWDTRDKTVRRFTRHGFGASYESLAFSNDGQHLLFASMDTITLAQTDGQEIRYFKANFPAISFSHNGQSILTNGAPITGAVRFNLNGDTLTRYPRGNTIVSSVAFSPDDRYVLTGGIGPLARLYTVDGDSIREYKGHSGLVPSARFFPNGKHILTSSRDGTIKIWDTHSGQERATLIVLDSSEWVVTSPSGLFDASPGAMRLLYYTVGLEVIELDQLKERYYEPGLLAKLMGYSRQSLREVSGFDTIGLYPTMQLQLDTPAGRLHIRLQERNGGLGKVSVFVNGKEIIEDANPPKDYKKQRDSVLTVELASFGRFFLADTLNRIAVRAYNAEGWLKSAAQELEYWSAPGLRSKGTDGVTGLRPAAFNRNPHLYIVAVGTSDYAGNDLDLSYADQDARAIAEALRQTGACLFGADSMSVYLLTTDSTRPEQHPTKTRIKAVFEGIRQQAKAEDVLVVYFSGHGISYGEADRALFYYLTMEVSSDKFDDAGLRAKRTISSEELTRWINDIPAQKQVLILDACNSGRVVENLAGGRKELNATQVRALDRMKDRTGMFVLTGSAADKVSYEAGQFGQGLLTYSLLEGMKGMQLPADRRIDVSSLFEYARDRVPDLAQGIGGIQTPMLLGPLGGSFDIGILGDTVRIELAPAKPVFVRNIFLDASRYDDHLGLSKAMDNYFRLETLNGAKASLVYVDIPEYDNAFSVKGLYTLSGDTVTVRGRFFQGKNPVEEPFEVTGQATKLDALVE